jgi:hypothetical protein
LWRNSHLLYGVESIPRTNYCQHPLSEDFFYLFLAADPDSLFVPVIQKDPATPSLPNKIIGRLMEPFWRRGWGRALCSVCLAGVYNGELRPVFLTRNEFLRHWEQKHLSSLVAVATFSATRLNSRIYQGHVLYLLASNADYSQDLADSPSLYPTNYSGFQTTITHSDILRRAFGRRSGQQTAPAPAPASGPSQPAPGPSQQAPRVSVPVSCSGQSAPAGGSLLIPEDLILSLTEVTSFSCYQNTDASVSYNQNTKAEDEKLLDNTEDGVADADAEPGSESLLDADDSTLGISRMDTDDHQEFPTPSEAYQKKPPVSDADAVRRAKKGAKKK